MSFILLCGEKQADLQWQKQCLVWTMGKAGFEHPTVADSQTPPNC